MIWFCLWFSFRRDLSRASPRYSSAPLSHFEQRPPEEPPMPEPLAPRARCVPSARVCGPRGSGVICGGHREDMLTPQLPRSRPGRSLASTRQHLHPAVRRGALVPRGARASGARTCEKCESSTPRQAARWESREGSSTACSRGFQKILVHARGSHGNRTQPGLSSPGCHGSRKATGRWATGRRATGR